MSSRQSKTWIRSPIFCCSLVVAEAVQQPAAPVLSSDPWNDFGSTADATVGGWADFNAASFDAGFATFNDDFPRKGAATAGARKDAKPAAEKVVGGEASPKDAKTNSTKKAAQAAMGGGAEPKVADAVKSGAESKVADAVKSAAGDLGDEPLGTRKAHDAPAVAPEPSKRIEGDCSVQSGSTDKGAAEKEKA
ncbi:hypothetical protein NQ318_016767 [Aromia moschata]|uniref:Uncharacterized protein n=1 Tax=Aromia moschata TaxID=1265417 RepID=A0AAV8Y5G3_9CUCU|nr:hypothetical protein NQ318_016767 [Aromia moschata]